jgi:FPC/CPF motif-containing protein YcgG
MFKEIHFFSSTPISGNRIIKSTIDRMAAVEERRDLAIFFKLVVQPAGVFQVVGDVGKMRTNPAKRLSSSRMGRVSTRSCRRSG